LPLQNLSPDPNDEYFADGMTEELISTISNVSGLSVISRTSVMQYKKPTKKIAAIGEDLGAGTIVEGSVRKFGNKIRVAVQLIEVKEDKHLWAQNYDRNLDDVFEVQSDVAKHVADALMVRILSPELDRIGQTPTKNMDAYALYLKGKYWWNKRGPEYIRKAIDCFELAIKQDTNFALAYVGLVDCYLVMVDWGSLGLKEASPKVKSLLATALKIDERLAEAHTSLAALLELEWELSAAEKEYKRAIELNSNYATAHHWYSIFLDRVGRNEEALKEITTALDLDPVSPQVNDCLGIEMVRAGRLEEAIEQFKRTLTLQPDFVATHMFLGETYVMLSEFDEGIAEFQRAAKLATDIVFPQCFIAYAYALAGDRENAMRNISQLDAPSKGRPVPSALISTVYFALGNIEKAYSLMKNGVEERSSEAVYVMTLPIFRRIQSEPRFKELLEIVVHGV